MNKFTLGAMLVASTLALTVAAPRAFAQGAKIIQNNTSETLDVVIFGRNGSVNSNLPPVRGKVVAGGSIFLQFGSNENPYMNVLVVTEKGSDSTVLANFKTTATGGPGTLDNLFNTNSTLVLTFDPTTYSYTLTGTNN